METPKFRHLFLKKSEMRFLILLLLICLHTAIQAQHLCAQLQTVNAEWEKYPAMANGPAPHFSTDRELIQTHLYQVVSLLERRNYPLNLPPAIVQRRKNLIAVLITYADSGLFPQNKYVPGRIPVFIDEAGTHCAVGYLMLKSGAGELARKVSLTNNYIYIRQLTDPAFFQWQAQSGFTIDELALIQPSYYRPVLIDENTPVPPQCGSAVFSAISYYWGNPGTQQTKPILKWQGNCNENGQLHGRWQQFYRNGIPFVEGWFKNGVKDSVWRIYFNDKSVNEEVIWKNGKKTGTYIRYSSPGMVNEKGAFENDLKTGRWTTWQFNGIQAEGNYLNGKKNGKWLQYYHSQDSIRQVYSEEWFDEGVMKLRKLFQLNSTAPYMVFEHASDSLFYFKNLLRSDYVQEEGHLYIYEQFQPVVPNYDYMPDFRLQAMYANYDVPPGFQRIETNVRTGKWIIRGNTINSRVYEYQPDSAWIYVQRDSLTGADIFKGKQHTSFECMPSPYRPYEGYNYVSPLKLTSKTTWENGKQTERTYYNASGRSILQVRFRDALLISGSRYDAATQQTIIWSEAPPQSKEPMLMTIKSAIWQTRCYGSMLDTATRHGYWEFYDTRNTIYAKGYYSHNQRNGAWEETDTLTGMIMRGNYVNDMRSGMWKQVDGVSGNVWMGNYVKGKRSGKWVLRKPDGTIIDRERY
jgi:antitoxin component YwqK of YwqJK toxin-antitoxin module